MHLQKPKCPQCAHGGGTTVGGPADERHVRQRREACRRPYVSINLNYDTYICIYYLCIKF